MGRKIAHDKSFQTLRINASACSASCVCDHVEFVGGRKKFVEGHEGSMHPLYIYCSHFFHLFPKIKRGMAAVCSVAPPLRIYRPMLRTVILVVAINSLKMKQMVLFFCFAVVERLRAKMISK